MSHEAADPLEVFLDRASSLARQVRNGRYHVRRGAVNWAAWPFERYRSAWSILCDSTTLLGDSDEAGFNVAAISFEIFAKGDTDKDDFGIDDNLMGEFRADARLVLRHLLEQTLPNGDPVVTKLERNSASATEALDSERGLQGLIVSFVIGY